MPKIKATFSQEVKNEIMSSCKNLSNCCAKAFLYGAIKGGGSLCMSNKGLGFSISSSNFDFIKLIAATANKLTGKFDDILVEGGKKAQYIYSVYDKQLLLDLQIIKQTDVLAITSGFNSDVLSNICCKRSFLKGLFMMTGSVVLPLSSEEGTTKYHFEFQLTTKENAESLALILEKLGVNCKIAQRQSMYLVYVKECEQIADVLVHLGAKNAKLKLEDLIIYRDVRNNVNRGNNCINANIQKSVNASGNQIEAITLLQSKGVLALQDKRLIDCAQARLDNPEATIGELADMLELSKSGVAHRLNKLIELAAEDK